MRLTTLIFGLALMPLMAVPATAKAVEASLFATCAGIVNALGVLSCPSGEARAEAAVAPVPFVSAQVAVWPNEIYAQSVMSYGLTITRKDGEPIAPGTIVPLRVDLEASMSLATDSEGIFGQGDLFLRVDGASVFAMLLDFVGKNSFNIPMVSWSVDYEGGHFEQHGIQSTDFTLEDDPYISPGGLSLLLGAGEEHEVEILALVSGWRTTFEAYLSPFFYIDPTFADADLYEIVLNIPGPDVAVPVPSGLAALATGLVALGALRRRRLH